MQVSTSRQLVAGGIVVALVAAGALSSGCGSESGEAAQGGVDASMDATQADAAGGNFGDGAVLGSGDSASCGLVGMACTDGRDCCSASCDTAKKLCVAPVGSCAAAGAACKAGNECCTFVCNGGACGADLCISDGKACTSDASCCGGKCGGVDGGTRTCVALNGSCRTSGNACTVNGDCCSTLCAGGRCSNQPSFCTQNGDVCSTSAECCGGLCTKGAGATLGLCQTPNVPGGTGCEVAGQVCAGGSATDGGVPSCGGSCCSRACAPYRAGVSVCQPPSGCRPTGEACRTDDDCCGSLHAVGGNGSVKCNRANANDPIGRCDNGQACRASGAVCKLATTSCNAENDCCAGQVNKNPSACQQDLLGIPRCTAVGNCADAGPQQGKACASSADCCGLPCVPNPTAGGAPFVCGGQCVGTAGKCTTNADCCAGLPCTTLPGSSSGTCGSPSGTTGSGGGSPGGDGGTTTCSLYGQTCSVTGDCCNGIPCTNGRCAQIIF